MLSMNSCFQGPLMLISRSHQVSVPLEDFYLLRKVRRSMHGNSCTILGKKRANDLNKIISNEAHQPVY
jgi:hypothetical protein